MPWLCASGCAAHIATLSPDGVHCVFHGLLVQLAAISVAAHRLYQWQWHVCTGVGRLILLKDLGTTVVSLIIYIILNRDVSIRYLVLMPWHVKKSPIFIGIFYSPQYSPAAGALTIGRPYLQGTTAG